MSVKARELKLKSKLNISFRKSEALISKVAGAANCGLFAEELCRHVQPGPQQRHLLFSLWKKTASSISSIMDSFSRACSSVLACFVWQGKCRSAVLSDSPLDCWACLPLSHSCEKRGAKAKLSIALRMRIAVENLSILSFSYFILQFTDRLSQNCRLEGASELISIKSL